MLSDCGGGCCGGVACVGVGGRDECARGVGVDTVVALLCPNVPAFATVFHGALRAGATVTTLNSLYTPGEIQKQLTDAEATWFVTVSPLLPQALAAAEAVQLSPAVKVLVPIGRCGVKIAGTGGLTLTAAIEDAMAQALALAAKASGGQA